MDYITEQEIDKIASETCKQLHAEQKVSVVVKSENGEAYWEGGINGHFFRIRTETPVQVPASLAKLIAQSDSVRVEAERAVRPFSKGGGKKVL